MRNQCLSIFVLILTCLIVSHNIFAETSVSWGGESRHPSVSKDLRWSKPKAVEETSPVVTAHYATAKEPPRIRQVQHTESGAFPTMPLPARQMNPAERDVLYPETRPQSVTPPTGATLTLSQPVFAAPTEMSFSALDEQVDLKNPSLDSDSRLLGKAAQDGATQDSVKSAPQPLRSPSGRISKEIECPDRAVTKSIMDISCDIRPKQIALPKECPLRSENSYEGRHFGQTCFQWTASNLCTKGAYFENVQLERYGHSVCPAMEPVISGAKFFLTVPLLPYKMGLQTPDECVYTLGHYRVGSCAPHMLDPFPITVRALLFEGAAVGGAVALIP